MISLTRRHDATDLRAITARGRFAVSAANRGQAWEPEVDERFRR